MARAVPNESNRKVYTKKISKKHENVQSDNYYKSHFEGLQQNKKNNKHPSKLYYNNDTDDSECEQNPYIKTYSNNCAETKKQRRVSKLTSVLPDRRLSVQNPNLHNFGEPFIPDTKNAQYHVLSSPAEFNNIINQPERSIKMEKNHIKYPLGMNDFRRTYIPKQTLPIGRNSFENNTEAFLYNTNEELFINNLNQSVFKDSKSISQNQQLSYSSPFSQTPHMHEEESVSKKSLVFRNKMIDECYNLNKYLYDSVSKYCPSGENTLQRESDIPKQDFDADTTAQILAAAKFFAR